MPGAGDAVQDDTRDRRTDDRLLQLGFGFRQPRLGKGHVGLGAIDHGQCPVARHFRADHLQTRALAALVQFSLRVVDRGSLARGGFGLFQAGFGGLQLGAGGKDEVGQVGVIKARKHLADLDLVVEIDRHFGQRAGKFRGNIDLRCRLDRAGCGDGDNHLATGDRGRLVSQVARRPGKGEPSERPQTRQQQKAQRDPKPTPTRPARLCKDARHVIGRVRRLVRGRTSRHCLLLRTGPDRCSATAASFRPISTYVTPRRGKSVAVTAFCGDGGR